MSTNDIFVQKNNGTKELFDAEKIHEKTLLACAGLSGVSASDIEMDARLFIVNNTKAKDIQTALINSAAQKISPETPNYEYAAARLLNQKLRKEVYGQYTPYDFCSEIIKRVNEKHYDSSILTDYSVDELKFFGSKIKYEKDDTFTYAGLSQLYAKYLIKRQGKVIETPQEVFMLLGMYIFAKYEVEQRKKWILECYRSLSSHEISLPTPIMNGLRTSYKRFVSCNVIDAGDTTDSIALAAAFIMKMTANKSGIGINAGRIRGLGADIGNGRVQHTGVLPILKTYEKATSAFTQIGRGGSGTVNYPWFHYEIELIMQLGNAKGTEDTRVRHLDHTIIFNRLFLERALNKENITIFHMNTVPGLFEALGDYDKFKELYEKYEKSVPKKSKKIINAYEVLELFINERFLQGRVYYSFADNIERGPWKQHDYISNLCQEILLKQTPLDSPKPEIAVCILAGINHGNVSDERIPVVTELLVRFLDAMIDYMDYSDKEIEYSAKKRRTLGIGDSDIFHFLAKNKKFYNTAEGRDLFHNRIELTTYHTYKASIQLAKEFGPCELINDSKYADGWLPIDSYCKETDSLITGGLKQDWEILRELLLKYGIRNSTIKATPPFGNSAKTSGSTNGAEPPRFLATMKEDKDFKTVQLVPEYTKLKNYYTTAWGDDFNNVDYFKFISLLQKFTDQSISTNQYTNLLKYNGKVPLSILLEEFLTAFKYGLKSMYYQNFRSDDDIDGLGEETKGCEGGGCVV